MSAVCFSAVGWCWGRGTGGVVILEGTGGDGLYGGTGGGVSSCCFSVREEGRAKIMAWN